MWTLFCWYRVLFSCGPSSPLAVTFFLSPLLWGSLNLEGRDMMETSHLGLSLPRFLIICIMSGCESHLFPSAAGGINHHHWWWLTRHWFMSTAGYHLESLCQYIFFFFYTTIIWFFPKSLGYVVSDSWSPKQCWIRVPTHGMGLKSYQSLVVYSLKLCATVALARLEGSTSLKIKYLYLA